MRAEYREGERFERLTFTGETFYDCDFSDCVFADCTFEDCKLDHSVLTECQFLRCTVTNLKTTMSRAKFTDFENCTLNNIDWMSLQGDGDLGQRMAHADGPRRAGAPHLAPLEGLPAPRLSPQPADQTAVWRMAAAQPQPLHTGGRAQLMEPASRRIHSYQIHSC